MKNELIEMSTMHGALEENLVQMSHLLSGEWCMTSGLFTGLAVRLSISHAGRRAVSGGTFSHLSRFSTGPSSAWLQDVL